ncbi:HNH endonuclease signature motif containing protein [Goodfellowiella coeruleoviolacea]|uniref:HNH nuclease domain-containing protein n=1 Tax=Goodfellowiella coeruleoviolacea TaxID=334858 RepID=A0AAE3GEM7_9PSEU|nr:HNH endonuclease signature motif containing protein [Goodfellowiella coeruleoviolacea]MCP2165939.1 protein of unknown function (DUF222) [Goodfellowiella coeruleoviolacea]
MSGRGDSAAQLDAIVEYQAIINVLHGLLMQAVAEYHRAHEQPEFAAAELALATQWTHYHANAQLSLAVDLATRLPATLAALQQGRISLYKARALAELTLPLTAEQTGRIEAAILAVAPDQNDATTRQHIRRLVHRIDPEGAERRHQQCVQDRNVQFHHADHGMAELHAYLPAHLALAVHDRICAAAGQARTPGDDRTADQRRADAFVDLCLGESGVQARIQVTVAATTLLGLDNRPGELAGYGEIPASVAREIAAEGTWRRLLTDPVTGALLDHGRNTYRPPAALADFVRTRDKTCRFPGCLRAARKSDIDHHVPFPRGDTSAENLTTLCRHHHRVKHGGRWQSKRLDDGTVQWISPTGRQYSRAPEPVLGIGSAVLADATGAPPF